MKQQFWQYVAMGDSTTFYTGGKKGMIHFYAEMISQDLGIKVELKNWTSGHGGAIGLLQKLQKNQQLRIELQSADLVTVQIPTHALEPALRLFFSNSQICDEDREEFVQIAFQQYMYNTELIFKEITNLCDLSHTVIRARDTYLVNVTATKAQPKLFSIYNYYWYTAQKHINEVAQQYAIPVAKVYNYFMGPEGTDDPAEKGWMLDITHANEEGSKVMAQLIRDLRYKI